jgi:hypothetical protein
MKNIKLFNSFIQIVKKSKQYTISQQRNAKPFQIRVEKNKMEEGFVVDKRVMPADQFFKFEIFFYIISELENSKDGYLRRGNALKFRLGEQGLMRDTIEGKIAIKFFNKKNGDSLDRRISVIANILAESKVCRHGRGVLILNSL